MTVPTIAFLLVGGAVERPLRPPPGDARGGRRARRWPSALIAVLSLAGALELWHLVVLVAVYGAAPAFFGPAFDAIVPDVLPAEELAQANSLDQLVRPLALRLAGPALGGVLIAGVGAGSAFALDAASFVVSAAACCAMRAAAARARRRPSALDRAATSAPACATCAATSGCGGRSPPRPSPTCCSWARPRCCCRSSSRTSSAAAPPTSAWCSPPAASARVACAVVMGQSGLPRRDITFMYVVWTLATLAVAGYGLADAVWQLMVASLVFNALETAGTIVWATAKQRHVPAGAARPRVEPRLADLDRPAAAVVRAHRPGQRRDRRAARR